MYQDPYEHGGLTGGIQAQLAKALQGQQAPAGSTLPLDPKTVPVGQDMPQPPPSGAMPQASNQFRNQLQGFDTGKLDAGKNDPKYRFAQLAQGYDVHDPSQRDALSKALAGDTSGFFKGGLNGDMIQALDPATGKFGNVDVIKGLDAGGQGWQWGAEGPQQAPQGGGMPSFGGSSINNMLQSDAQGNIQQALSGIQQPGLLQQLIAALGGGQ